MLYVVSVFGSGGKSAVFLLWRESFITTGKKKFQSSVWQVVLLCQFLVPAGNRQFFCCGGKVLLRPETKSSSRLVITTGKKSSVVSVFGSGKKSAVKIDLIHFEH